MKGYEIVFIMDPNTPEDGQQEFVDRARKLFADRGGEVVHHAPWGRRKLAYRVKKHDYGVYHLLYATPTDDALRELENQFRYTDSVIKWLSLKVDDLEHERANFERLRSEGSLAQKISDRGR